MPLPYAVRQQAIADEIDHYIRTTDFMTAANGFLLSTEEMQIRFIIKNLMYYQGVDLAEYEKRFGEKPDRNLSGSSQIVDGLKRLAG